MVMLAAVDESLDQLEKLDLSDMLSYRNRAMQVATGKTTPNNDRCLEWMLADAIEHMKRLDEPLANDVVGGFCTLLRAQTAQERVSIKHLGPYLHHREVDVGRPYVSMTLQTAPFALVGELTACPDSILR